MNRVTKQRLANHRLLPLSRFLSKKKEGKPWQDSRGRWYETYRGTIRRCAPPKDQP